MRHISVMLDQVLEVLNLKPGMRVVDGTLGDAGHAEAALKKIAPNGRLLGIDADPEALIRAKEFLSAFEDRVVLVRGNFANMKSIVKQEDFFPVQAILLDLGWSTPQFAERNRGFSFHLNEPLDMRYSGFSEEGKPTAAQLLEQKSTQELEQIFESFGEEKLSHEIAQAICEKRKEKKIETTQELVNIILEVYRKKLRSNKEVPWIGGLHPATKVFQALRIAVNEELSILERVLPQAIELLDSKGRLAVITFHSLEDRIVKHFFKSQENISIKILSKKPLVCSEEEYKNNPPSRSAKLRVIEKL